MLVNMHKIFAILQKKSLLLLVGNGIIIKRDCTRYALKREVAACKGRFFRGVCPILNRAKEISKRSAEWRFR